MTQHITKFLTAMLLLTAGLAQGQFAVPFWSENFTGGIPAGWTNVDASNQGVLWTWCTTPDAGTGTPGCPPLFNDGINQQSPFAGSTATTGFATVNSDGPGALPSNHISRLTTTAIDCSGKDVVFVKFQAHIGVYEIPGTTGALLRVSTNGTTWTDYTIFPNLTTSERWSKNPEIVIADISATAANQSTVYLQWSWTGNWEYFWNLDDVEVYAENPTPRFDIEMVDFFYPASSFASPVSQIQKDTFGFFAYLSNKGLNPMTNIRLTANVKDASGATLFESEAIVPILDPGVVDSAIFIDDIFAPELPVGEYTVNYSVSADSTDQFDSDNSGSAPIFVTDFLFSKEDEAQSFTRTSQDVAWAAGNYYRMTGGSQDQFKAVNAMFAFDTDETELPAEDVVADVLLFKLTDAVAPNFDGFDDTQLFSQTFEWLGFSTYEAPEGHVGGSMVTVPIEDLETGPGGVLLDPNGRYFLVISYNDEVKQTNHGFNKDINYVDAVSTCVFSDQWYLAGFGPEFAAVARMEIALVSTTDEKALDAAAFRVFPNPASSVLNLAVDFEQPTDATITIAHLDGRVIQLEDRQGLTNENIQYTIGQLPAGMYLARIATPQGTKTIQFVVAR